MQKPATTSVACQVHAVKHHGDAANQAMPTKHLGMGLVRESELGYLIQSASTGSTLRTALRTAFVTEMYTSSKALPGAPPALPGTSSGRSCRQLSGTD